MYGVAKKISQGVQERLFMESRRRKMGRISSRAEMTLKACSKEANMQSVQHYTTLSMQHVGLVCTVLYDVARCWLRLNKP